MNYYIFKTNNLNGETTIISNGSHKNLEQCVLHFRSYAYGFFDAATEILGGNAYTLDFGKHEQSFVIKYGRWGERMEVEYFMLFDKEGQAFMDRISNGHPIED